MRVNDSLSGGGLTRSVAEFLSAFDRQEVPRAALDMARSAFIDLVGVMLAARDEPVVGKLTAHTADAAGPCSLLLRKGMQRSASAAALVNGTAAHALDYDDVQFNAHPSTVLVPALLAAAERSAAPGERVLRAYVAGYEVWGELHRREPMPYHDKGWHPTSVLGTAAAAAAVAYLRGLDAATTQAALSLAGSFTGGVVANFGAMSKSIHAGRAASSAITTVDMAQEGITAGDDGLGGMLAALSPSAAVDLAGAPVLGRQWFFLDKPLMFKKYPVCFATHRSLDALLELAATHGITAADVEAVEVEIRATQARLLRFDRPRTGLEAKFSMHFGAACALLRGRVALADLDDAFVASAETQALMQKVRLVERGAQPGGGPAMADRVVIRLRDGRTLDSGEIAAATPHRRLREKFLDCCQAGGRADGERLLGLLEQLHEIDDLRQLAAGASPDWR